MESRPDLDAFDRVAAEYVFFRVPFRPTLDNLLCYPARPHAAGPVSVHEPVSKACIVRRRGGGMFKVPIAFAALVMFTISALPGTVRAAPDDALSLGARFRADVLYGSLDGFAQTPRGGGATTTSRRRPSFDELGIDSTVGADVELGLDWRAWTLHWGARFLHSTTSATLDDALVSQGASFPAGTDVRSQLQLDTYRAGVGRHFSVASDRLDALGVSFQLTPLVEAVIFDFGYRLEGTLAGQRTHREYTRFGSRIGARSRLWRAPLALEVGGFWGLPIGTWARISTFEATASYAAGLSARIRLALRVGVLYEHIDVEDSQSTPNRIEADYGPALTAGLALRF